jgi:hypothetical protein
MAARYEFGNSNWSYFEAMAKRDAAERRLQNAMGRIAGIKDWPADRVFDLEREHFRDTTSPPVAEETK